MSKLNAQQVIEMLKLQPHVEGGYYKETYRSAESVLDSALPPRYVGEHALGTAIYYLLTPGTFSAMHRLKSDEVYHFYLGDPVEMLLLAPDGDAQTRVLGQSLGQGQLVQTTVPNGFWQGSRLRDGGEFALLGCTVCPGFTFDDFEEGSRAALVAAYPQAADNITRLTRK